MSQRAAWQLERLGHSDMHDFVAGKAYWLASGRPTVRAEPIDRVGSHLTTDVAVVGIDATAADGCAALARTGGDRLVVVNDEQVVLGTAVPEAVDAVTAETPIVDVMRAGPTTIRPDEATDDVRRRMQRHGVTALVVTAPTGQLLGLFQDGAA